MAIGITIPPTPLWDKLIERVEATAQASNYLRQRIPNHPIIYLHNELAESDHQFSLGSFHITDHTDNVKYLYQWPYTWGEFIFDYLLLCEEESGKKFNWIPHSNEKSQSVIYFTGASSGLYTYVDITSCYYSLYRSLPLDSRYFRNKTKLAVGEIWLASPDEFGLHKQIRNMTFGLMRKDKTMIYKNQKFSTDNKHGRFYRPDIVAYVLDTVQAIATEAKEKFKIHAWLTDAAILPTSQAAAFQDYLITEWHLDSKQKYHGKAWIFSSNCYIVGPHMTAQFTNLSQKLRGFTPHAGNPISTIIPVNIERLKKYRHWLTKETTP